MNAVIIFFYNIFQWHMVPIGLINEMLETYIVPGAFQIFTCISRCEERINYNWYELITDKKRRNNKKNTSIIVNSITNISKELYKDLINRLNIIN